MQHCWRFASTTSTRWTVREQSPSCKRTVEIVVSISLVHPLQSPARGNSWLTWLVLSSSCETNEIGRQEWSSVLTRRSPRSTAVHTGKGQELGGVCQQQQGRGSRLPR